MLRVSGIAELTSGCLCFVTNLIPAVANRILHLFPSALWILPPVLRAKIAFNLVKRSPLVTRIGSHVVAVSISGRISLVGSACGRVPRFEIGAKVGVAERRATCTRSLLDVDFRVPDCIANSLGAFRNIFPTRVALFQGRFIFGADYPLKRLTLTIQ